MRLNQFSSTPAIVTCRVQSQAFSTRLDMTRVRVRSMRLVSSSSTASAGKASDDDVEQADDAVDDSHDDRTDGSDYCHDGITNCLKA